MTFYRSYAFPTLVVAAVASAAAAWIHDWALYYAAVDPAVQLVRGAMMAISAAIIAAGGSVLIERSLRQTGVLQGFPE